MLERLRRFCLLTERDLNSDSMKTVRLSVLRIIILTGLLLAGGVVLHSALEAYAIGAHHIIAIILSFYLVLLLALVFSFRFQIISSILLITCVFGAGLCILLFVHDFELSKLGLLFVYAAPLISLMLFPLRVTVAIMLVNFIPFGFLLLWQTPISFLKLSIDLPDTHHYVHILLFLFFNLCIPLSIVRVFSTLKRNTHQLRSLNEQVMRSNKLYEEVFENSHLATLLTDQPGTILKANSKALRLLRLSLDHDVNLSTILTPKHNSEKKDDFWLGQNIECLTTNKSIIVINHIATTEQGHFIFQLEDISALRDLNHRLLTNEQQQKVWRCYDTLTHLPNLNFFSRLIRKHLQQQPERMPGMLIIVRICNIKQFNQSHGYSAGDGLISAFAKKVRAVLPAKVMIGRIRGVKFILWSPLPERESDVSAYSKSLYQQLPTALPVEGEDLSLAYEFGATVTPASSDCIEKYIEQCESALEFADYYTNPIALFNPKAFAEREAELQLVEELKAALSMRELCLWLQPKVNAAGKVYSFEALLRWERKPGQFVPAYRVVQLAEQYGFIVTLSEFVLNDAVRLLTEWRQKGLPFVLSINLAGPDIIDALFFAELVSLATHKPWLVDVLELELTETSIITQSQLMYEKLGVLRKLGFNLAIDDFGTGQASLSLLAKLPATTLKLDRSFLTDIPTDTLQVKVLQTTIQLAKSLNLELVVEGVETDLQRRFLMRLGCEKMQGYLFAKPNTQAYWHRQKLFNINKSSEQVQELTQAPVKPMLA
ncbi:bifunctional diguanylate cyclase/phosphodiesterase [Alkalimonas collagenimarina]|uniref:Bifunctional diguanylate cyclase/phosphodiesterase n=1 Tax=Alkalimonas collagenimarina TaxID=400390 RepID=A0ABT9GUP8_9GAMM|nr:bifunctional diguanylate cyclase/phosphodiesterase [Alkalimonas collagenimarina]MDP4534781.1 bifunctional diguanylate cyclase/phosphodiesterase [Alkalimonas collagenimarina]